MRRWLLLAVLFSLTAWATLALTAKPSADAGDPAAIVLDAETPAPGTTGDPNARWEVAHRPGVSLPESCWKLATPDANLGVARSVVVFTAADRTASRPGASRSVPTSLVHIPLLI